MKLHNCGEQLCHNKIPMNEQYCSEHISKHVVYNKYYRKTNRHQPKDKDERDTSFYNSVAWRRMRTYVYGRDLGICQVCGESITNRKIVDHVHPLRISPDEKLKSDNLWTLCYRCHQYKTQLEYQTQDNPNGENKLKHMSKEWYKRMILKRIEKSK